jgi:hypothetical protein
LITQLSGRGETPEFSPHITLLGQLPQSVKWIKAKMIECFHEVDPIHLSFSHVGMTDQYFRSIIIHAHPNPVLEQLHTSARQHFEIVTNHTFVPHLSLLYSHLEPHNKKLLMESIAIGSPLSVTIKEAVLVETNGGLDQWQEVFRIPLS